MHVDNQQTTFRSLTESELDQVSGGLAEVVLGAAAMVGIQGVQSLPPVDGPV